MKKAKTNYREKDIFDNLQTAIELEHGTIPPYLTAMFTINQSTNPDAYFAIRSVVMEEMLHMTLACNILNAIGGSPAIDTPRFIPEYPLELDFEDRDFKVGLIKFSKESLKTFLDIESPGDAKIGGAEEFTSRSPIIEIPGLTIGDFYALVGKQLEDLCKEKGEKNVFVGDQALQVGPEHYYGGGGEILKVTCLKDAQKAIAIIVDQGEGVPDSIWDGDAVIFGQGEEVAHYFRFNEILQERFYSKKDKPRDQPSGEKMPVDWEDVKNMIDNPKAEKFPKGSLARQKADEFNQLYTALLHTLHETFNGKPDAMRNAVGTMWQLKYLADALLNIEIPNSDGKVAGPPFEFVPQKKRVAVGKYAMKG